MVITSLDNEKVKKYTIFWEWPYEILKEDGTIDEKADIDDFEYIKSNSEYIFEIEIYGKQGYL